MSAIEEIEHYKEHFIGQTCDLSKEELAEMLWKKKSNKDKLKEAREFASMWGDD